MNAPTWITDQLWLEGVPFEECRHPDCATALGLAHREHFNGRRVAKVVVVMADGRPAELVLPASRKVDLEKARSALGACEIRLATEAEIGKLFPDCEPGSAPPLRHGGDLPILMDPSLIAPGEDILIQAGTHRDAIRLSFDGWFRLAGPRVVDFSTPAQEACR